MWRGRDAPAEIRDLSSKLKWRCYKSVEIRGVLENWVKENSAQDLSLQQFISALKADSKALGNLQDALSPNKETTLGSAENLWEAIKYSLKTREKADHYGFLESAGSRYLFAAPGIEWGAMMASLAASGPGIPTNLGEVSSFIVSSGVSAPAKDLLSLLERTGLARGSADADAALQVETAYRRGDFL